MLVLQPPSSLVIGPPGSGKTSSIPTQLLGGLKVFVMMTEPGGVESLIDACDRLKAPLDNLHWTSCLPASAGFAGLEEMITKINSMDQKSLSDQRDMGKADFRAAAMKFLNSLKRFHCERTGLDFADFTTWDDSCALNIDSLTGWSHIAWGATVGYKPTANPGEWGIAQKFIENLLLKINNDRKCYFNLFAHMEKEIDEMTGVKKAMVSTIGAKLAPKIPTFFSEVILTKRVGTNFFWSTTDAGIDLKNRSLPISDKLAPDFRPIISAFERRKKLAGGSSPPPSSVQPSPPPSVVPQAAPMQPQKAN